MKLVAMLGLVPSAHEMENAFTCAQERPGSEAINHQSAALKAIFTHRWSCDLVAPACTYAMGGENIPASLACNTCK